MSNRDIILGGAQFGYQYGKYVPSAVSNIREINELLDCALENDCSTIDIAQVYEGCVERLSSSSIIKRFKIINKIVYNSELEKETRKDLLITLNKLCVEKYESVAIHNWSSLNVDGRRRALDFLNFLQSEQITSKKGIAVYDSFEVKYSELHSHIDQIQAPLNFFKRDFLKHDDSFRLVNQGLQFHARSIFAQGTLLSASREIVKRFPELRYFRDYQAQNALSPLESALSIFDSQSLFTSIVIGVSSSNELLEILESKVHEKKSFFEDEATPVNLPISDPRNW
jgi:aryl-alcohol dehydrogenase-like predicted oxidoreductase